MLQQYDLLPKTMKNTLFYIFIFCYSFYGRSAKTLKGGEIVTYVGAVFEYEPYNIWVEDEKGYGIIQKNAQVVTSTARMAKLEGTDILMIPEYSLTSLSTYKKENYTRFYTFTTYVPDPADEVVPCDSKESNPNIQGLKTLSCTARKEEIYLGINMLEANPCNSETVASAPWSDYNTYQLDENCPESGFYFHNTEIVLDRTGTVIVRYRKQNLYVPNEDYLTPGSDDATAFFVSDFNVPFTVQICFDIKYENPAYNYVKNYGVKDVIQSTAWVDSLPFGTADTEQNSWSRGLGVNLIISGYHDPEIAKMGSGIYRQLFDSPPVYTYDKNSGNVLLIAEINTTLSAETNFDKPRRSTYKKREDKVIYFNTEKEERTHYIYHESLQNYSRVTLKSGEVGQELTAGVCDADFCCNITYQYTGNLIYMLLSFKGQSYASEDWLLGSQNCAVMWCASDNITTCAYVEMGLPEDDEFGPFMISTSNYTVDSIYPSGLHRNISLINNDDLLYSVEGKKYSLSTNKSIKNLLVAYMYGRWYDNDTYLK